jgi:hypothetical protein
MYDCSERFVNDAVMSANDRIGGGKDGENEYRDIAMLRLCKPAIIVLVRVYGF